ncbi:hypothetical protein Tamer19_05180 [Cupriavidus sp. TA19]|nr:hypothetical protein Tamer19_05180 [Cupriavidus sp. TA19]
MIVLQSGDGVCQFSIAHAASNGAGGETGVTPTVAQAAMPDRIRTNAHSKPTLKAVPQGTLIIAGGM